MNRGLIVVATLVFLVSLFSCNGQGHKPSILSGAMSGYSNEHRERKFLKDEVKEISGMVFLNDGQKMASVNDEEPKIFIIDYANKDTTTSFTFGEKGGDFEDIVMDEKYYYVLESRGRIYKVPKQKSAGDSVVVFKMDIKNADFEAMYLDSAKKRIVMLCKSCPDLENSKMKPAYAFDLTTNQFSSEPVFTLDVAKVRKLLKSPNFGARPSAAAIHPILKKIFIVCSQDGKGLLICNLEGNIEQAIYLDESLYPQPEGITFSPNGDLYISNEGLYQPGSIIRYPYRR
jgi:hypothetical protein